MLCVGGWTDAELESRAWFLPALPLSIVLTLDKSFTHSLCVPTYKMKVLSLKYLPGQAAPAFSAILGRALGTVPLFLGHYQGIPPSVSFQGAQMEKYSGFQGTGQFIKLPPLPSVTLMSEA